jgi:hypothetical protein
LEIVLFIPPNTFLASRKTPWFWKEILGNSYRCSYLFLLIIFDELESSMVNFWQKLLGTEDTLSCSKPLWKAYHAIDLSAAATAIQLLSELHAPSSVYEKKINSRFSRSQTIWVLTKFRPRLVWVLKFNKHCSTFVLFDKKFPILD